MARDANFSEGTKRIIAGRAGYDCSFPGCSVLTIGPGASATDVSVSGVAAHIYSSASGGPRGTAGLSTEDREAPTNGIWLCETHGKLIDNNRGTGYPPPLLIGWKHLQETKAALAQANAFRPFGWILELQLGDNPIFEAGAQLHFGKVTVIYGDNGTGKTALCEWLAGLSDTEPLERWLTDRSRTVSYAVKIANPADHLIRVTLDPHRVQYTIDGQGTPANPIPLKFIHVRHPTRRALREDGQPITDIEYIASALRVAPRSLLNFLPLVEETGVFVKQLRLEKDEDGIEYLSTNVSSTIPGLPFASLSGGETRIVIIELAISMAQFYSRFHPTMLMIELGELSVSDDVVTTYWSLLQSKQFQFQTIFTTHTIETLQPQWKGWGLVELSGSPPTVQVLQDEI